MLTFPGCAFSLPACVGFGDPCGDHWLLPHPWSQATDDTTTATHQNRQRQRQQQQGQLRPFPLQATRTNQCNSVNGSWGRVDIWQPISYLPRRPLAERIIRQQQLSMCGRRSAADGGGEVSQGQQQQEGRVLFPPTSSSSSPSPSPSPPATALSSYAGHKEDVVILDDPFEELEGQRPRHLCVVHNNLSKGPTPYVDDWEWQQQTLARLAEHAHDVSSADAEPDRVLLTQHDAVLTLGTGSTLANLRFEPHDAPFGEVVRTERGGEVTYHGPGQIVMYPIMNLRRYRQDIHWYLRALEETVIRTLAKLGLKGERIKGLTGVWVEGRKVAAVGVRVRRWITMHGLSLNVRPNLDHFKHIVPCGIGDRPVGSLEHLCADGEDVSVERVGRLLLESFEEVFGVSASSSSGAEEGK
ncbi:unnamed protein product [Pylaiella littoralis]